MIKVSLEKKNPWKAIKYLKQIQSEENNIVSNQFFKNHNYFLHKKCLYDSNY